MIRSILWDNDGVLVDTEVLYFEACRETLASVGVHLEREQYVEVSMSRGESVFDRVPEEAGFELDGLRRERDARYSERLRSGPRAVDGIGEVLASLQGRVRMGVVTSSRREHFEIIHASTGLLPFFEFVVTREDVEKSKPDPEPYRTALETYGLDAGTSVAIEDSERGLQSAVRAGIRCVAIPTELTKNGDFSKAWRVLEDVRGVPEVVLPSPRRSS